MKVEDNDKDDRILQRHLLVDVHSLPVCPCSPPQSQKTQRDSIYHIVWFSPSNIKALSVSQITSRYSSYRPTLATFLSISLISRTYSHCLSWTDFDRSVSSHRAIIVTMSWIRSWRRVKAEGCITEKIRQILCTWATVLRISALSRSTQTFSPFHLLRIEDTSGDEAIRIQRMTSASSMSTWKQTLTIRTKKA